MRFSCPSLPFAAVASCRDHRVLAATWQPRNTSRYVVRGGKSLVVMLDERFLLPKEPVHGGGHASLFKAYDSEQQAHVAVKIFNPAFRVDPKVLQLSWSNELESYQKLGAHPNLLEVVGFGTPRDGDPWIAFEWCGEDLKSFAARSRPSWTTLQLIARELLSGLSVLHQKGYVHRDVKPGNVLVDNDKIKLADFGTMRFREVTSYGLTMAQLGTQPYCPPESGTDNPTPAYDVYSFAVTMVCCLVGDFELVGEDPSDVLLRAEMPETVRGLLLRCLDPDPAKRPGTASVLLAELEQLSRGADPVTVTPEIGVRLGAGAEQSLRDIAMSESAGFEDFKREFGPRVRVVRDAKSSTDGLLLVGRSLASAVGPGDREGTLYVRSVWRPPAAQLERLRRRSLTYGVRWTQHLMRPGAAVAAIGDLYRELAEFERKSKQSDERSEVHARWERVLDAKTAVARESGKSFTYSAARVEGARVFLSVPKGAVDPQLGELRTIRSSTGRSIRGEIESIEDNEIVLYVSDGDLDALPIRGVVNVDSERTLSKIRREQDAVRRVFEDGAVRGDLKDLLNNPALNPTPEPLDVPDFFQDELDDAKRDAVSSVLGSTGISLIKGPPGTGKTTLIAELVAQQLRRNPKSRILLASQTHIALDHALHKVTRVSPDAAVLRIGSPDHLTSADETWTVPAQLELWRQETERTVAQFISAHLSSAGVLDVELRSMATRFRSLVERRGKAEAELVQATAELVTAREEQSLVREGIERLFNEVGRLDAASVSGMELTDVLAQLSDQVVRVGTELEQRALARRPLGPMRERVAALQQRIEQLATESERTAEELRQTDDFAGLADEHSLLERLEESLSAEEDRAQSLRVLADEWLERFRPTAEFRVGLLFRASLVASTCVALTGVRGAERVQFDLCIVDEASKATPTELMVPMANARQWVLVGDEKQLPPFLDPELVKTEFLERRDLARDDVDERLFAALGANLPSASVSVLTHQHRMHQDIGRLVSDVFYGGALKSTPREISPVVKGALGSAVSWKDTGADKSGERRQGSSYENRLEAQAIATVLREIDSYARLIKLEHLDVAILSGYAAQVRVLQEVLSGAKSQLHIVRVKVATIDSFQGQEADICVLSLTRDNRQGDVGFLGSAERLNVAISRARDGLVVVGNFAMGDRGRKKAGMLPTVARAVRTLERRARG